MGDDDAAVGLVGERILVAVVGLDLDMGRLLVVEREGRARVRQRDGEGRKHACARALSVTTRAPARRGRSPALAHTNVHSQNTPPVWKVACVEGLVPGHAH